MHMLKQSLKVTVIKKSCFSPFSTGIASDKCYSSREFTIGFSEIYSITVSSFTGIPKTTSKMN
jgi:hypothetical protein